MQQVSRVLLDDGVKLYLFNCTQKPGLVHAGQT